jgi:ferredoxin
MSSLVSPFEVAIRERPVCDACRTKDCIRGQREPENDLVVIQRGCELALFQPLKAGNMDCTFCLDCVLACPHNNVGIVSRLPASELMTDPMRSGIGLFSRRKDLAALAIAFTFGALLNAFGMISPVYRLEAWLASALHIHRLAPILALLFIVFLVVAPAVLLGLAARITRMLGGSKRALLPLAVRYSYALVPLGFGMWLAHYGFHFFTGVLTIVPITQSALAGLGWPVLGDPLWTLTGISRTMVQPLEIGFLILGLAGSLLVTHHLAMEDAPEKPMRAFVPWATVCVLLWIGALWLISQPMDMRGTFISG